MKLLTVAIGWAALAAVSAAGQEQPTATTGTHAAMALAVLQDAQGWSVGEARLQQTPHGVLLRLDLKHATPGIHALHFHEVGRCDGPTFESAGTHVNPAGHQHGLLSPRGFHAGDLPNLDVPSTQQLSVEYLVADVTLTPGPQTLFDANGSALVMHAGKDDYASDPADQSGDRMACGHLERSR